VRFPRPDPARARRYREEGQWQDWTIPALIGAATTATPRKCAVRDASGIELSYEELEARARSLAGYLAGRGVGAGDIVTICLPNWWQAVVAFLAVMRIGGVLNPVPVTYGRAELADVLGRCGSAALFIPGRFRSADFTAAVAQVLPDLPEAPLIVRVGEGDQDIGSSFDEALSCAPLATAVAIRADDVVAVLFTSGTESRSKGTVHTHNTILFGERALGTALAIEGGDIAFMASPISHATGFMHGVVMTLTTGGTLSLLDVFDGTVAARQMKAHRCTWTMGATPFLADITAALESGGTRLPELRYFLCGGAPVPESLVRRAMDAGLRVLSVYGSTESPPHTVVHPDDPIANAWTTDGRPLAGIEVRIASADGSPVTAGEVGEEWSRGPNTFIGYLGEPELTGKYLDPDGWYHSGDLARMLPDGSIRIVGRLKDIIIRGGQNISAGEVEGHLAGHPAVQQVAVVGEPHPRLGETACAVVVTRPGHSLRLEDLTSFLIEKGVARFKLPERLEVWRSLPMTPSGKIQKFLIRKSLGSPSHSSPPGRPPASS
jgi:acyl-CoA synthetase